MIICIQCSPDTKAKMDGLLEKGQYRDYSELVSMAVDSLWVMEQEVSEKGAVVFDAPVSRHSQPSGVSDPARSALPSKNTNPPATGRKPVSKAKEISSEPATLAVPQVFSLDELDSLDVPTIGAPGDEQAGGQYTLDQWLFGQYNKLLPLKANCRALMRAAVNHPKGMPLEETAKEISEAAAVLGDFLADHDSRHQNNRDDALATAFPRTGVEGEKGRMRYANQFVGSVNSQNKLSGLLKDYRMAALTSAGDALMLPTEAAIRFAQLRNPVLDGTQESTVQKFSGEEISYLLDHIRTSVPEEEFAFRAILKAISEGANTPDSLDEALQVYAPESDEQSFSKSFLSSQRSGALSRMADLGLVTRERKGVRVSYLLTKLGHRI